MERLKTLFESFLYLVVVWLSQLVAKYLYVFIILGISRRPEGGLYTKFTRMMNFHGVVTDFIYETQIIYIILGWILALGIIIYISRDLESVLARQLLGHNNLINVLLSIVIGGALVLIVNGGVTGLSSLIELPIFYVTDEISSNLGIVFNIVAMGVIIPVLEELFFRWLLMSRLKHIMPYLPAIIIQSVLFSMFHLNLVQGVYVLLLGLICGYVVARTKVIFNAVIIHVVFNITNIYLLYITDFKLVIGQLILVLVAGVIMLYMGLNYLQYTKVSRN